MDITVQNGLATVTDDVSSIKPIEANSSEESRIKFVTDMAAISRGKLESSNPEGRYKQLLKEAALGTPSRPLEFLPIKARYRIHKVDGNLHVTLYKCDSEEIFWETGNTNIWHNDIVRYSYLVHDKSTSTTGVIYTNMRCLLNAGIDYASIPYNKPEDLMIDGKPIFFACRIKAPMFVFNQLATHTALSKEARSERVTTLDTSDYWIPYDLVSRLYEYIETVDPETNDHIVQHMANLIYHINGINTNLENMTTADRLMGMYNHSEDIKNKIVWYMVNKLSTLESQELLHTLGYKKEIYQRAVLELRYKVWVMTGFTIDPNTWEHMLLERGAREEQWKNWVQPETKSTAAGIRDLMDLTNVYSFRVSNSN